jgi:hypothetical protein
MLLCAEGRGQREGEGRNRKTGSQREKATNKKWDYEKK